MNVLFSSSIVQSLTEDSWRDMVKLGAGTASNRQRRQSQYGGYGAVGTNSDPNPFPGSHGNSGFPSNVPSFLGGPSVNGGAGSKCQCNSENSCPAGPAGPIGALGNDGLVSYLLYPNVLYATVVLVTIYRIPP